MTRLNKLFDNKKENVLAIYFSAGHPKLDDTTKIINVLDKAGADIIEIGIPFSDPVADGPIIQQSSLKALENGMSVRLLFEQLESIRQTTQIPIVLMGYFNPVLQYGIEAFCEKCSEIGIDGVILPDLPPEIFYRNYKNVFEKYGIANTLLAPPQISDERLLELDEMSTGFLYIVSSSSTTGTKEGFEKYQIEYFERLEQLKIKTPRLIGFGISDRESFFDACKYSNGAIIGSAFIKALNNKGDLEKNITDFISGIR